MFDSYLLFMFWAHRACKLKYKPPDRSGRTRLVFPPDPCLKHDDNLVPFITTKTVWFCFSLWTTLGQPRYFQKRHQPVLFLFVDGMWEKGVALKSTGKRAVCCVTHSDRRFLLVSFLLFPRVQKQTLLSILLLDRSIVSMPGWRYLERSLIIFTLLFYTHKSLTQFRWSKHSGTAIFFHSICTQYLALRPPTSMENIKCFSDINAK